MTTEHAGWGRAAALATEFDRSFSVAPALDAGVQEDLLAISVAGEPYAIPLSAIDELVSDRPVTRLVGTVPGLLGIAGLRGALIPVFDLAALLGRDGRATLRWLVLTRGQPRLALAFAHLGGHLRVPRDAIAAVASVGERGYVRDVVRLGGELRPIVHVASILETIAAAAGTQGATRP